QKAEQNGEKRMATQKMLFDVYLELGDDDLAEAYLNKFKNLSDFDYLIRLAKWSDHQGNLENAITYFEMAKRIAESAKNKNQLQWIYSNLGDVYGHANRISDSYDHYLKALELNPDDAYSLKGIAWIIYSHEKNPKEALRILDRVTEMNASPDYFLLKAEIAEFMNDSLAKEKNLNRYLQLVTNKNYGQMYNKHNILLATDEFDNATNALEKAQQEIKLRATPQSYDLLAWSYYVNGDVKKALTIVEEKVVNKTFEPEVQYHIAEIYKANGLGKDAKKLKRELLESAYELGPLLIEKIKLL
ncbi:MAG: tetratricopeptide repeat protein, partial [Flavobacteriaceae bacterium]|nr:tetratricopeptide repeat protein [Flavobacteriaceae bacterium]